MKYLVVLQSVEESDITTPMVLFLIVLDTGICSLNNCSAFICTNHIILKFIKLILLVFCFILIMEQSVVMVK